MAELVSGLLARLDDLETAAKRALAGYPADDYNMESAYLTRIWRSHYHEVEAVMTREPTPEQLAVRTRDPRVELVADCGPANVYPARHIALNDPQAVLRLCRAHRKIIERHRSFTANGRLCCCCCGYGGKWPVAWPCDTLRDLAEGLGVVSEEDNE